MRRQGNKRGDHMGLEMKDRSGTESGVAYLP